MKTKRAVCSIVCLFLLISFLSFSVSADTEAWILVIYQYSDNGTTWSSNQQMSIVEGQTFSVNHQYFRVNRIYVLNTTNKPSNLFISFTINVFDATHQNTGVNYSNYQSSAWSAPSNFQGYFRTRFGGYIPTYEQNGVDYYLGSGIYFVGQYAIPNITDTNFYIDNENQKPTWSGVYTDSNLYITFNDVSIVFVGQSGEVVDYQGSLDNFEAYLDDIDSVINDIQDLLYQTLSEIHVCVEDIWTFICDRTYAFYRFQGWGSGLLSSTTSNPFQAICSAMQCFTIQFSHLCNNNYWLINQDDPSTPEVETLSTNWFNAVLETLKGINSVFAYTSELQQQAEEAGANDVIDDGYAAADIAGYGDLIAVGDLAPYNPNGLSHGADGAIDWFSNQTLNDLNTVQGIRTDDGYIDFYEDHMEEIEAWRNGE